MMAKFNITSFFLTFKESNVDIKCLYQLTAIIRRKVKVLADNTWHYVQLMPIKVLIHMKLQRSYVNTKCSQQWPSSNHTELQHTPTSHIICSIFNEIFLNYSDKSLIIPIHDFSSRSTCSRQVLTTSDATVDFVTLCRCDLLHLCLIIRRVSHSTVQLTWSSSVLSATSICLLLYLKSCHPHFLFQIPFPGTAGLCSTWVVSRCPL